MTFDLFIYLFIFAREKQIDFTDVSKITVRFQMIGNRTYVLHEKCDLVTGQKFIFFIRLFLLLSSLFSGLSHSVEGFVA